MLPLAATVAETFFCTELQTGVSVKVLVVPVEYVSGAAVPLGNSQPLGITPKFHVYPVMPVVPPPLLTVNVTGVIEPQVIGTLAGVILNKTAGGCFCNGYFANPNRIAANTLCRY